MNETRLTQRPQFVDDAGSSLPPAAVRWSPDMTPETANRLYLNHSSDITVPAGRLATDLTPRKILRGAQILVAKRTIRRKLLPFRLDTAEYAEDGFVYDTDGPNGYLERLKRVELRADGTRYIHEYDPVTEDYCILFYGERFYGFDFDDFVSRVDISRVGDCFRNVLGINTRVLHRDDQDRPTLQVERIAALAQPDYTAFLGKDELDVYKLEFMEYRADEHRNWMRTVCSPNVSTVADDGYLAVRREETGIRIEFVARQQFPLPRMMRASRVSRVPPVRRFLAHRAYESFWCTTVDNILARYEGRPFRIGSKRAPLGFGDAR